jgi:TrmH family RNA methyltransferase
MITKSEIKYIQSLAYKKFREEERSMVAEGVKTVNELLCDFPDQIQSLYATAEWISQNPNLPKRISCVEVQEHELEKISFLKQSNKVLAIVDIPQLLFPSSSGIFLMLDQIQDPGNLGTIIRTADWFGVRGLICSSDTADAYAPKVVQSTMGSIFRMPILYTDLVEFLKNKEELNTYAATLSGNSMVNINFKTPCCLIIGNESKGISPELLELSNHTVSIPKKGQAESLNAAIATAVLLSRIAL